MKNSKIMLSCIATFICTWLFISVIGYLLTNNVPFKEVAANPIILMLMIVFGWIPSVIVGTDMNKN